MTALREVVKAVREDIRLVPVLLPVDDGLLVAAKKVADAPPTGPARRS
jgi:hypothetical protein